MERRGRERERDCVQQLWDKIEGIQGWVDEMIEEG